MFFMARTTDRTPLQLNGEDRSLLEKLSRSLSEPLRKVQRAKILLLYASGITITEVGKSMDVSRETVYKWIDRALAAGVPAALEDKYHRPFAPVITPEARAWIIQLVCLKPKDLGYAAELWTTAALAEHARVMGPKHGHPCLGRAAKATVWRILNQREIKPRKVQYYLERRDPEFGRKQAEVLIVYREVSELNARGFDPFAAPGVVTVSVDEKPGVQAIKATGPELPPVPDRHPAVGRDYEYERLGTLSILAGIDLHSGYIHACAEERHRSSEFTQPVARPGRVLSRRLPRAPHPRQPQRPYFQRDHGVAGHAAGAL